MRVVEGSQLLLVALLAACGGASGRSPDGGAARADAGTIASMDAGDSGAHALDASSVIPGDAGGLACQMDDSAPPIKISADLQLNELADLAARDGILGLAYLQGGQNPRVYVADAVTLSKVYDGTAAAIGTATPVALDYADGLFFVAGNESSTAAPLTRLAWLDPSGAAKGDGTTAGFTSMAAAREQSGARVLALAALDGDQQPVYVNRYDPSGALLDSFEIGRDSRTTNEWDLDWSYADDHGIACGVSLTGSDEFLALFELTEAQSTAHATGEKLVAPAAAADASFGCRLALDGERVVVALAEGEADARLLWLTPLGETVAGPVPFATSRSATSYDVATSGALTALAFLDDSSGVAHLVLRVYPGPARTPLEIDAESGLGLQGTDLSATRVRLAGIPGGFLVAFDAGIKSGQSDIYVRRVQCQ